MNLFKKLPTSHEDNFEPDGFEGQAEYLNPIELLGTRKEEYTIDKYKNFVSSTFKNGATLIGGCCEVKPRHIEAIKDLF